MSENYIILAQIRNKCKNMVRITVLFINPEQDHRRGSKNSLDHSKINNLVYKFTRLTIPQFM